MLYNTKGEVPEGEHVIPLGKADVKRAGSDVTLICHSKTVSRRAQGRGAAGRAEEIDAEVVDLRTIRPLDTETVLASVAKTHRVRRGGGGLAVRRRRRPGGGPHPARGVRRARRPGPPGDRRRRPDAVQQAAREGRQGRSRQRSSRRPSEVLYLDVTPMATKVVMEALSPTMEEGRLVEWKKKEGDAVAVGDVLAEVETDKAVMELVARAGGTLLKQVVAAGHDGAGVRARWRWIGEAGRGRWTAAARRRRRAGAAGAGRPAASPRLRRPRRRAAKPTPARTDARRLRRRSAPAPTAAPPPARRAGGRGSRRRRSRAASRPSGGSISAPSPAAGPRAGSSQRDLRSAAARSGAPPAAPASAPPPSPVAPPAPSLHGRPAHPDPQDDRQAAGPVHRPDSHVLPHRPRWTWSGPPRRARRSTRRRRGARSRSTTS